MGPLRKEKRCLGKSPLATSWVSVPCPPGNSCSVALELRIEVTEQIVHIIIMSCWFETEWYECHDYTI